MHIFNIPLFNITPPLPPPISLTEKHHKNRVNSTIHPVSLKKESYMSRMTNQLMTAAYNSYYLDTLFDPYKTPKLGSWTGTEAVIV
jgi:hypothetical protein